MEIVGFLGNQEELVLSDQGEARQGVQGPTALWTLLVKEKCTNAPEQKVN